MFANTPFSLSSGENPQLGFKFTPLEAEPVALTVKHQPKRLADIVGQGAVVNQLSDFLDAPYPRAFLFHGPTGVGKTTAAEALARDLGINMEFGSLHRIKADDGIDRIRQVFAEEVWRTSLYGSKWHAVLVDEADGKSDASVRAWLTLLDAANFPPNTIIIFTTNHIEKFQQRFLDRCEVIEFASDANLLAQDATTLIRDIWTKETGSAIGAPKLEALDVIRDNKISFRRVVEALEPMLRKMKRQARQDRQDTIVSSADTIESVHTVYPTALSVTPSESKGLGSKPGSRKETILPSGRRVRIL